MPKIVDHDVRKMELARAVLAVVARDGVGAASVRAVAAEAGWTHGAIGHYFKRRDDLLLFAYRLAIERETESAPKERDEPDPFERLVGLLLRTLPVDDRAALDVRIWLGFMGRVADEPDLAEAVLGEHKSLRGQIKALVQVCKRESGRALDVEDVTDMITVYSDGLGIAASLDPKRFSADGLEGRVRSFLVMIGLSSRIPTATNR